MTTLGPLAYHQADGIYWLQITVDEKGKCIQFQQSKGDEMTSDTWTTLPTDQWPALISVFDPEVSQNLFLLGRNAEDVLSRYYITPIKAKSPNEPPRYRIMSQTHTGTHFSPAVVVKDEVQQTQLLESYWRPESEQQAEMKVQLAAWQQNKVVIWHEDPQNPALNLPNQPLDFQTTQRGVEKPPITNTDLNAYQQWWIKSVIQDRIAFLKAESQSSLEYREALHHLIDAHEPAPPLSAKTQENLKEVKKLISSTGINQYMKKNFYSQRPEKQDTWVPLVEDELGYDATIGSVIFYIQQLLQTEIHQFFPEYLVEKLEKPVTITTPYKVGKLPVENADAVEESASRFTAQELAQIDSLYPLMMGSTNLSELSDNTITELHRVVQGILNRSAITESIATTLQLLLPSYTDDRFRNKISDLSQKFKHVQDIRQWFQTILNPIPNRNGETQDAQTSEDTVVPEAHLNESISLTPDTKRYLASDAHTLIKTYSLSEQSRLIIGMFQTQVLTPSNIKSVLETLDPLLKETLYTTLCESFSTEEVKTYQKLYAVLKKETVLDINTPIETLQSLADALSEMGPKTLAVSQFLDFVPLLVNHPISLDNERFHIDKVLLARQINAILDGDAKLHDEKLIGLFQDQICSRGFNSYIQGVMRELPNEKQVKVLYFLLNHPHILDPKSITLSSFMVNFSQQVNEAVRMQALQALTPVEQTYYDKLSSALSEKINIETLSIVDMQFLKEALDMAFPNNHHITNIAVTLTLNSTPPQDTYSLIKLQRNINGYLLAEQCKLFCQNLNQSDKQEDFKVNLIPFQEAKHDLDGQCLSAALDYLSTQQRIDILLYLLNNDLITYAAAHEICDKKNLEFTVLFSLVEHLSAEKIAPLFIKRNGLKFLDNFFTQYSVSFNQEPSKLLDTLSEDILDKLVTKISYDKIREDFDPDLDKTLQSLPNAHTNNWEQARRGIHDLFSQVVVKPEFRTSITTCVSPRQLKALLIQEAASGSTNKSYYFVMIAFERLAQYEAAVLENLSQDAKRCYQQCRSCGALGETLALELQCLRQNKGCENKLAKVTAALQQLPEKMNETELHAILQEPNHALTQALFASAVRISRGLTLFAQKKPLEPDLAFIAEIKEQMSAFEATSGVVGPRLSL